MWKKERIRWRVRDFLSTDALSIFHSFPLSLAKKELIHRIVFLFHKKCGYPPHRLELILVLISLIRSA